MPGAGSSAHDSRTGPAPDDPADTVARNRDQQATLYGEPLGELLGTVTRQLGLSQARVARILGLSPPMLSQLSTGHRVKIGNPVAVHRLQALVNLAGGVAAGRVAAAEVAARLADIANQSAVVTQTTTLSGPISPAPAVRAIQGLLRATAGAGEYLAAADQIEGDHPAIARLLRVYGAGRTQEAIADFESHAHLI